MVCVKCVNTVYHPELQLEARWIIDTEPLHLQHQLTGNKFCTFLASPFKQKLIGFIVFTSTLEEDDENMYI